MRELSLEDQLKRLQALVALIGLAGGLLALGLGRAELAGWIWMAGTLPVLAALLLEIIESLRRGDVGLDIVAALSMSAALATGETLAAAVVALMYSGGTLLESYAEGRARHEMHALLSRVPRSAMRHRNGALEEVPLEDIAPGDRLLVRQGDVVPVDGFLGSDHAILDQSALTGESLPVRLERGDFVMSGVSNAGEPFDIEAKNDASDSTYAGIVRLVESARKSKAPMSRLADRYSLLFLALTLAISGGAWWMTGDPIRAVAVLVVATPCPLILAVPVALVAGLSRAARYGVLIKGAGQLETLARIRSLILDKTGTLTDGRPKLIATDAVDSLSPDEILRIAASLDQVSKHPIAEALVRAARNRDLVLSVPGSAAETPGEGVVGRVDGHKVVVGGTDFVMRHVEATGLPFHETEPGAVVVALAVDGRLVGRLELADALRDGTGGLLTSLRAIGIERILLATGDRRAVAEKITEGLGFDVVRSEMTPDQKVLLVLTERKNGPVMMVGDGVNDAPALAAADVGVAMGARGAAASAEAADVVLLVDQLDRVRPGVEIAKGARRIALESVFAGIGLSVLGMIAAAFGYITPVEGALLQEVIDVAVILNALRVLRLAPEAGTAPLAAV